MNSIDKTERQREHFDEVADRYYEARLHQNHLLLKDLIWRDFLSQRHELKRDRLRVLEPMCGFADGKYILEKILGLSVDYTGFDYSESVVSTLRKKRPDLRIMHSNVETYHSDELFDLIILIGGLHHVPHIAGQVVQNLARSMRPGGYFISFEPTNGNPAYRKIRQAIYRLNPLFDEQTERAFEVEELFSIFRNSGLQIVDVIYPGLLSYVLYYNPEAFPWINVAGPGMVKATFRLDRMLFRNWFGKIFSFATMSLWQKNP
jgi:SAM-dependent methyltransferase